jgi:hypothetical protein
MCAGSEEFSKIQSPVLTGAKQCCSLPQTSKPIIEGNFILIKANYKEHA